jgi:hypothetical protein
MTRLDATSGLLVRLRQPDSIAVESEQSARLITR